jgi:hypothetical protein
MTLKVIIGITLRVAVIEASEINVLLSQIHIT